MVSDYASDDREFDFHSEYKNNHFKYKVEHLAQVFASPMKQLPTDQIKESKITKLVQPKN